MTARSQRWDPGLLDIFPAGMAQRERWQPASLLPLAWLHTVEKRQRTIMVNMLIYRKNCKTIAVGPDTYRTNSEVAMPATVM